MNKYETILNRCLAMLIDGVIFSPIIFADLYVDIDFSNKYIYTLFIISGSLLWLSYSVFFHGKSGQTIGKKILKIKVLDVDEQNSIGYKRAFLRELPLFAVDLITIFYFIWSVRDVDIVSDDVGANYENIASICSLIYIIITFIAVIRNSKRRAIHDFIARSVVVNIK